MPLPLRPVISNAFDSVTDSEAEHHDVSMQVGADRLFPEICAEPRFTVVAATGVSCRQHIAHGTTRRALLPVELFRAAIAG
jgi:hypothetical protein